ncbi:hypothetical protein Glove_51g11 [Diversispora epigaea]|uniref:Integrator complex subunit 2 n=1 Tax=Diversispora epigaea TaxID=1348612 RepID=A0A397JN72_9GLOM|nr:hypothetical protein Glove_51g11 [Diversispora epigaea]
MITIKSKLDGTPESKTFALLEKGGPDSELNYSKFLPYILMNYNNPKKYPFLTRYSQYDKIYNFLSIDQNEIKSGIRDDSYPKIPSTSAMDIDIDPVPLNSKKMMKLILQDVNDLTKSSRLVYQQNTNQVGKYCDLITQDRSLFRYLRRNDVLLNLDYYLPIMLYKWDLTAIGIDYEAFLQALLLIENGPSIIHFMVMNNPPIFDKIVKILVRVHNNLPPRNQIRLKEALEKMVSLARSHAHFVRMVITDLKILPELALEITLYVCSDVPLYCEGIFTRNTKWLTSATYSKDNIDTLHNRLMKALETEIEKPQSPPTNHRTRLCILIRIVCGFVSIFNNIRLSSDEIRVCLRAIKSAESERLKKLCLSFILLFADRIVVIDRTLLTSNFAQLVKPENTQLFILFAYFFHTNKLDFIEKLCREILTLDVVINVKGLKEIQYSTRGLFQEKILARSALNIDPNVTFSGLRLFKTSQDFAYKCFYVMLKGGVFHKGGLNIQPWILKQIQQIKTPIHPQFIQLLKAYVNSIFIDHSTYPNFYPTPITKIPEKEIYEMFVDCDLTNITPSHILMCYYILTYNSTCLDRKLNNLINAGDPRKLYSYDLTELIPVRMILFTTEIRGKNQEYKYLYPELLALISNNYPEIFDIDNLLTYEDWELKNKISNDYLMELLIKAISELDNDSSESASALKQIAKITPEILYEHSDTLIIYLLPKILDKMNLEMLNSVCEIWLLLYSISPHEAVLYFVNGLRNKEDKKSCFTEFQLMLNPALIFRIDGRVFRCTPLYKIFLKVLKFYMMGSRQRVQRVYQENAFKEESSQINIPLAIIEQEVLLLTTVLEICIAKSTDEKKEDTLSQIRDASFRFLHQIFLENSDLLKHLHFAGYSKELVPLTTSKIESMHACLHWIHEIVNHEDNEKQLFGLFLAGNLCEVWPMQQTCEMAKKIIFPSIKRKVFDPTTKVLSPEAPEILTILLKLHRVFEELRHDIVVLLRDIEEKLMIRNRYKTTFGNKRRSQEIISQCLESIGEKPRSDDIRIREIFRSQVEP